MDKGWAVALKRVVSCKQVAMGLCVIASVTLCGASARAADFTLGADVDASYYWNSDRWGAGVNVYPGITSGGGLVGELQLGYQWTHQDNISAIFPLYIGARYDFADLIGLNDWHPILSGHAGVSILRIVNKGNGLQGPGDGSSRPEDTNGGLGGNVALGLDYSDSNERAVGVQLQQNWAAVENGTTAKCLSIGISGRVVF